MFMVFDNEKLNNALTETKEDMSKIRFIYFALVLPLVAVLFYFYDYYRDASPDPAGRRRELNGG